MKKTVVVWRWAGVRPSRAASVLAANSGARPGARCHDGMATKSVGGGRRPGRLARPAQVFAGPERRLVRGQDQTDDLFDVPVVKGGDPFLDPGVVCLAP